MPTKQVMAKMAAMNGEPDSTVSGANDSAGNAAASPLRAMTRMSKISSTTTLTTTTVPSIFAPRCRDR